MLQWSCRFENLSSCFKSFWGLDCVCTLFSPCLGMLSRSYLILVPLSLWDLLDKRDLEFPPNTGLGKAKGVFCSFSQLECHQQGPVQTTVTQDTVPPEALLCSPSPSGRFHAAPSMVLAPAAWLHPARVSRGGEQDWRPNLPDAYPLKGQTCICGYMCLCVFISLLLYLFFSVKSGLCGFILGQKYSSWYCTVMCMKRIGGRSMWYKKGPWCPPFLICGCPASQWGLGAGTDVCPNVNCSVDWCVLKSLVLLCERTSPPGALEVYVQNNKWQMNNHNVLLTFCFLQMQVPLRVHKQPQVFTLDAGGGVPSLYFNFLYHPQI